MEGNGGEALNPAVTHWEIPDAEHTGGISAVPVEYERRVIGFFETGRT